LWFQLAGRGAVIEGRVELPKAESAPVVTERYGIISANGVMSTNPPLAIVYVEGHFPRPAQPTTTQLVQKDLAFIPALLPIQIGTRVEFPNLDPIYHNVYSYSRPKRFDLGRFQANEHPVPAQVFDVPGLITVRCEIHEHMRGLILVLDTPHFVVTDSQGRFRLNDVPPGHYVLKVWLNSETTLQKSIDVAADGTVRVDFP
jgi:plastocyanin